MTIPHAYYCSSLATKDAPCDCTKPAIEAQARVDRALRDAYRYGVNIDAHTSTFVESVEVAVARAHSDIFWHVPVGAYVMLKPEKYAERLDKEIAEVDAKGGCRVGVDGVGSVRLHLDVNIPRLIVANEIYSHVAMPAKDFPRKVLVTPGVFAGQTTVALDFDDFDDFDVKPGDFRVERFATILNDIKCCEHSECYDKNQRGLSETWDMLREAGFNKRALVPVHVPPGKRQPWNAQDLWKCPTCGLWSAIPFMRRLTDLKLEF